MTVLVVSIGAGAAEMEKTHGFKTFSEIKSTDFSNLSATVTGGGIDFKTGSRRNFENILLEPEREFDAEPEPKKGLGILGAELALRLGRRRRVPVWIPGPQPVSRSMGLRGPFSEGRRLPGPGQLGSGSD